MTILKGKIVSKVIDSTCILKAEVSQKTEMSEQEIDAFQNQEEERITEVHREIESIEFFTDTNGPTLFIDRGGVKSLKSFIEKHEGSFAVNVNELEIDNDLPF